MMAGVSGLSDSPPLTRSGTGPSHNTNFKQQFSTSLENMAVSTHNLTTDVQSSVAAEFDTFLSPLALK